MANAKRASMREGPLAALFRKTEEAEGPHDGASPAAQGLQGPLLATADAPDADTDASTPAHPRDSGLPHPALRSSPPAAPTELEQLHIPSPRSGCATPSPRRYPRT